ncbi:MAG: Nif11-like leader peptide family natural product precursor [Xenococcaceae cyanobacterium]
MSQESLQQFFQLVLEDKELENQLRKVFDKKTAVNLAVALGTKKGYNFTASELNAYAYIWE